MSSTITSVGIKAFCRAHPWYLIPLLLLAFQNSQAQPWAYDFGTTTGTWTTGASTTFFTGTPAGGGTYRARVGTGAGSFTLANPGTTLGSGSELQITAPTTASATRFSVYSWTAPSVQAYFSFKLRTTSATTGSLGIRVGTEAIGVDNNAYASYAASLVAFRIAYTAGAISLVERRGGGSSVPVTGHGFVKDGDQEVEIYANNATAAADYSRDAITYTLNAGSWDLWVDGVQVSPANGWPTAGIAQNVALGSIIFFAESSTSNSAVMYLDDLEYSNALPSEGGVTCGIAFGTADATCDAITNGIDTYTLTIPYTGSEAGVTVINNSGSGTVGGDDPAITADGTIVITGISESDDYSVTLSAPCASLLASGTAPVCMPLPTIVINEVDYDQESIDTGEFIELMNTGTEAVNIDGMQLILVNGSNGSIYSTTTLPDVSVPAGGYHVVCYGSNAAAYCDQTVTSAIQNGDPDGVRLVTSTAVILDQMSYGGSMSTTEGTSAPVIPGNQLVLGLSRIPDGADTDDNGADFQPACITPGDANNVSDVDSDGTLDCVDLCDGPEPGTLCDDGDPQTGDDVIGTDCICAGVPIDCEGVAGGPALTGTTCDDEDPTTINDTWNTSCDCVGESTGPIDQFLVMEVQTDGAGSETTWEILTQATLTVVCNGGPLADNAVITESCDLPQGCYILRVYDSMGDGMTTGATTGGYTLRYTGETTGAFTPPRIIDNRNNFLSGSVSAIANDEGFCLPLGTDRTIFTSCDKLNWTSGQHLVASLNPAVTAEYDANALDATSGYEYWFFDPNGSYSFRRFRSHANNDGYGPLGYDKAAHLRLNNWTGNQLPVQVLLNVRVRSVVNGVAAEWGPACRFMLDPVAAACPQTQLLNIPGHVYYSCGSHRFWATNQAAHANPVSGASQYEFRFRQPAEGFEYVRSATSYFARLGWTNGPVLNGTYDVDVRAMKNGVWCDWGPVCQFTICPVNTPCPPVGDPEMLMTNDASAMVIDMWPNPNRGDQLYITLSEVPEEAASITVDMFDLYGKRVMARTIAAQDGFVNTVIDLNGDLAAGMYMVNITAGEMIYTQRLVVQP